jgi:type IV secretory pathway protease TraF
VAGSLANPNYTVISGNTGTWAVNPATLTYVASAASNTYGAAIPALTGSVTGLVNNQTLASATTGSLGFSTTATASSNVGSYPVTGTGLTVSNGNYVLTQAPANANAFAITPATLTYVANAASGTYGAAIPSLTGSVSGFVNNQTLASATTGSLGFSTTATPGSNVGSYTVTGTGLTANNGNYVFVQTAANASALTIAPAPIVVTALGGSSTYGGSSTNPGLSASGLQNGQGVDVLTGLSNAFGITNLTSAGSYPLNVTGALTNPNYIVTVVNSGAWTVNPATLTYVANPTSVSPGSGIPTLTGTVTGFVNGDSLAAVAVGSPSFSTPATANSGNGNYPINGEGLTVTSSNYVLIQAPANVTALTIAPANTGNTTNTTMTGAQIFENLIQNPTFVSLSPSEVVNTQPLNQPLPGTPSGQPPRGGTGPQGSNGLPPQFGARFFVSPPPGETRFIKDEVVLQIPTTIPPARLQSIMGRLGLSILASQNMGLLGVTSYHVHIGNGASINSVIQALASYQVVAGAQANYTYSLVQDHAPTVAPELAQDPDLAGLTQEGDAAQYALSKLGLFSVHRQLKGANVPIAVIDSQIDVQHPDLDGVIAEQYDAVGNNDAPHPHGTGMAGAIASHRRLMGIAPSARLYAIHAFSSSAASAESTTFNILKGLDWAASKGVRVINMSFAGPRDPSMERALKAAHDKGIVLIAAAGNAGPKSPPLYPGADPNVIAVTATDVNDKLFSGANRGPYIAVAAPGVDVLVPAPGGTYQLTTGTSVSSAEVSGIAALLIERNPDLKPEDIRKILTASAKRLGSGQRDDDYGSGLVDPSKAIQTAGDLSSVNITGSLPPPTAGAGIMPRPPADPRRVQYH